jgi:hypothetical protein
VKNKEFLEFLISQEAPPSHLKQLAALDVALSFKKTEIIVKFLSFEFLGALFSLIFCPQFGLGLPTGHGITHHLRHIGDWACASFCGFLFFSSAIFAAFMAMRGEELWWIWRRYRYSLIFLPALFWSGLMVTNLTLSLPSESLFYHLTWIFVCFISQKMWFEIRTWTFLKTGFNPQKPANKQT